MCIYICVNIHIYIYIIHGLNNQMSPNVKALVILYHPNGALRFQTAGLLIIRLIVRTESGDPELSFSDAAIGLGFL